jgi:glycerol-1-phosphatase
VLTGVSRPADAVLAPPQRRPTYLARDLQGLLTGHPAVTPGDGGFHCGGWTADLDGDAGKLELAGSGDPLDGLRALCGAAWSGSTVTPEIAASAVQGLDLHS